MKVVMVEPHKKAVVKEIEQNLSSYQKAVGGYIEAVYPWADEVAVICDEEAKLTGKELNRLLVSEDGDPYDVLTGTFFICGLTEDDFGGLSDELAAKYLKKFLYPESFLRIGKHICCVEEKPGGRVIPIT